MHMLASIHQDPIGQSGGQNTPHRVTNFHRLLNKQQQQHRRKTKALTSDHRAGRGDGLGADGPRGDDGGRATLGGVHAGDGAASLAAAEVAALKGTADVRVGVLDSRLPVDAHRVGGGGGCGRRRGDRGAIAEENEEMEEGCEGNKAGGRRGESGCLVGTSV